MERSREVWAQGEEAGARDGRRLKGGEEGTEELGKGERETLQGDGKKGIDVAHGELLQR